MGARSPRVVTSAYDIEIGGDIRIWHIASFWCAVNFGRYRGIADSGRPSTAVTGRHGGGFLWAGARWVTLHGAAFLGGGPLGPSAGLGALRPLDHLYWLTSRHGSALIGTAADAPHVRSCTRRDRNVDRRWFSGHLVQTWYSPDTWMGGIPICIL